MHLTSQPEQPASRPAAKAGRWSVGRVRRWFFWVPVVSLILLWQLLYLPHLRDSPGWYGDETITLMLSRNLFHGQTTLGPCTVTYWHSFPPYWPGYLWSTGFFSWLTGNDILGARFFNTLIALSIALLIYLLGRTRFGFWPAWFGAALFLTYDQNIIHFRWVYCHNAVALGFAVLVLYLLRPSRPANDWRAGVGLAIGALAHPLFAHGAIAAVICRLERPRAWVRMAILPAIVVLLTFLGMLIHYWPKPWVFNDIVDLFLYYRKTDAANGGAIMVVNTVLFYTYDAFQVGSLIGAILCLRKRYYPLTIVFVVVSYFLLRNRGNLILFYYQAIILSPIFAMCWAAGLGIIGRWMRRLQGNRRLERFCYAAAFCIPLSYAISNLPRVLSGHLMPRNQALVTQSRPEVEVAAEWLNRRTMPEDLVLTNSNLAWLLKARSTSLLHVMLWEGSPAIFFERGFPRERFIYPSDYTDARYYVSGDIDKRWTLREPSIGSLGKRIDDEKWPKVWEGKYYTIYANPRFVERYPGL